MRASPVFSAIETPTVPVPDWLAPEVMVANAAFDEAVHAQPALVVTPMEAMAPVPAMVSDVDEIVKVQVVEGGVGEVGVGVGDAGDLESEQEAHTITTTNTIERRRLIDRG